MMECLFLGTAGCVPEAHEESPMLLLNGKVLVDCGWNPVSALMESGIVPGQVTHVLFTHMHHDHYMGLVQLIFYFAQALHSMEGLTIAGPAEEIGMIVRKAIDYLQLDRFYPGITMPTVVPLKPGDELDCADMHMAMTASRHPVPGLMYRVTDTRTGRTLGITGDTVRTDNMIEFFTGCDALIHETALSTATDVEPMTCRPMGHSTLAEAIECAEKAHIPVLLPIHMTAPRRRAAQEMLEHISTKLKVRITERGMRFVL